MPNYLLHNRLCTPYPRIPFCMTDCEERNVPCRWTSPQPNPRTGRPLCVSSIWCRRPARTAGKFLAWGNDDSWAFQRPRATCSNFASLSLLSWPWLMFKWIKTLQYALNVYKFYFWFVCRSSNTSAGSSTNSNSLYLFNSSDIEFNSLIIGNSSSSICWAKWN